MKRALGYAYPALLVLGLIQILSPQLQAQRRDRDSEQEREADGSQQPLPGPGPARDRGEEGAAAFAGVAAGMGQSPFATNSCRRTRSARSFH